MFEPITLTTVDGTARQLRCIGNRLLVEAEKYLDAQRSVRAQNELLLLASIGDDAVPAAVDNILNAQRAVVSTREAQEFLDTPEGEVLAIWTAGRAMDAEFTEDQAREFHAGLPPAEMMRFQSYLIASMLARALKDEGGD